MKLSKEKKIGAIIIVLIVVFSAGGAVTILGIGENVITGYNVNTVNNSNSQLPANAEPGEYTISIISDAQWVAYIIVDGHNIQKTGNSNATIDLGHVNHYASITIDQTGIGTTTVNLKNPDGKIIDTDNTNSAETNALFFYLRMDE